MHTPAIDESNLQHPSKLQIGISKVLGSSLSAFIVALISLPRRPVGTEEEEEKRRSGIMDGFRYVRSDRTILSMIMLIALTTIFIFPTISVMLPLYVRNVLQLGPDSMGWLMATSGTGAFLGSLGLLSIAREKRLKFMSGNVLAIAAGVFFMSRSHSLLLTACSMGVLAIALSMAASDLDIEALMRQPDSEKAAGDEGNTESAEIVAIGLDKGSKPELPSVEGGAFDGEAATASAMRCPGKEVATDVGGQRDIVLGIGAN